MTELTQDQLKEIKTDIEDGLEAWSIEHHKQEPRTHLGISEIGEICWRKLYYKFHWVAFEEHSGRMLRLFNRGHREEERYVSYLQALGHTVYRFDETGKQFRVSGVMGHYGGSCDGVVILRQYPDVPFLGEFKTHNTKSFVSYINDGLVKSKPKHYDQMSCYGYHMNIQYGIYFPENKNDDDIQITVLKLDWERAKQLEIKAKEIITTKIAPNRISDNPSYFECKYCTFLDICHHEKIPLKNCRSCRYSDTIESAQWFCTRYKEVIPSEFIKTGCEGWTPL